MQIAIFFAKKNISHEISYQLDFVQLMCGVLAVNAYVQKYSTLRYLLLVKGLVICFYLGWSGSILPIRTNIIKVCSKSWLLTCSSNISLSLPLYTVSALKRELNFCNGYVSLLYFWYIMYKMSSLLDLPVTKKLLLNTEVYFWIVVTI